MATRKKAQKQPRKTTPKKKGAKTPHLSPGVISMAERQRIFLEAIGACGSITGAAAAAQIDRTTHYRWLEQEPYAKAYEAAKAEAIDTLERAVHQRAVEKSDLLAIFLLKAANPAKYRDRWQGDPAEKNDSAESILESIARERGLTETEKPN